MKDTDGLNMPKFLTFLRRIRSVVSPRLRNMRYMARCRYHRADNLNVFYLVFEPSRKHPGVADRIKAIMSCYDWAKMNGYRFKVYFETPFKLSDYLKPKFDWEASLDELEYSFFDTRFVIEDYRKVPVVLMPNKQYHCYTYNGHHMPEVFPDSGYRFSDLFKEMFEPSDDLKAGYRNLGLKEGSYVSCHLRFVNALEYFEKTFFENGLKTQGERLALIKRCKEGLMEIVKQNNGKDVYVFSDSKVFLDSLSDIPVKVLSHDNIGHVSEGASDDGVLKSFFDIYVMSKGSCVYRFCAPELYSISHYALLAATIGNLPFKNINV